MSPLQETGDDLIQKFSVMMLLNNLKVRKRGRNGSRRGNRRKPFIRFSEVIVVLHAFQKKSKKGSATPKQDMDLIHSRLKMAEEIYKLWKKKKGDV